MTYVRHGTPYRLPQTHPSNRALSKFQGLNVKRSLFGHHTELLVLILVHLLMILTKLYRHFPIRPSLFCLVISTSILQSQSSIMIKRNLMQVTNAHDLDQLINEPTRITESGPNHHSRSLTSCFRIQAIK